MSFFIQWIYVLSISLWVGSIFFFSFLTTPTLFATLPREMAGQVISALFPRYYMVGYWAGGFLLVTTLIEAVFVRQWPVLRLILIGLMMSATLYAGLVILPQAHNTKVEMKSLEAETPRAQKLEIQFKRQHRLSVYLNFIVLIAGLFLIGIIAFRLRL